jgi:hypothetical protein
MEPKYLYTIRWTQPYATPYQRPYMRSLQEQIEQVVERWLEDKTDYPEAKKVIRKIQAL